MRRFLDDNGCPVHPTECHFFGGIVSGLLGGGSSSSSSSASNVQVDVEVNPQIGVAVDLAPVADLAGEIAAGNVETGAALAGALQGQGDAFIEGFSGLADAVAEQGKMLAVVIALGAGAFWFIRSNA